MQTLNVKFIFEDYGLCKQVFKSLDRNQYFVRLYDGAWYHAIKDGVLFEPSHLVDENQEILVTDGKSLIYFNDSNLNENKEKFPFLKEFLSKESSNVIEKLSLSNYDDWKSFLIEDMYKHDYKDYIDNWLHFDVSITSRDVIGDISYLGQILSIVKCNYVHDICKKEWSLYTIVTPSGYDTEDIIGYKF